MRKIYIGLLISLLSISIHAQDINLDWAKSMGGVDFDEGRSIWVDTTGNVYTTGSFQGTVDFDPGTGVNNITSAGNSDGFIQKLDTNGNLLWVKAMQGTGSCAGLSICVDVAGNIYTTGSFEGTVDFDPGPGVTSFTSSNGYSVFIQKLDAFGTLLWAKAMIGSQFFTNIGHSLSIDNVGNIIITGQFGDTLDFDPGPGVSNLISNGTVDIFIQKLDANGNFLWAKSMGGTESDLCYSHSVDASGNIYTTGYYWGLVDFDPGPGVSNLISTGMDDIFIQKLDANGNLVWVRSIGGKGNGDTGRSLSIDVSGNIYTIGTFEDTVDFDPEAGVSNLISNGSYDIFIQKMDTNGKLLWAKSMGGTSADYGNSLSIDASGNIYNTGAFIGTVDFDPGPGVSNLISSGSFDFYIQKLDANGNFLWAKSMGETGADWSYSLLVDASLNIYTTGSFMNTVDFDPGTNILNLASNGRTDIFIQKFSPCNPTTSSEIITTCTSYISPSGNYTWSISGTYIDTIPNGVGCDSIITIELIVNNNSSTINPSTCYSYISPSGNYTWSTSGTYMDTILNSAGCDSVITVELVVNNDNSSTINPSTCYSYISPSGNYTWLTSGTYLDTISNINGCDSIITINLIIEKCDTSLGMPNVFTPNQDGINDFLLSTERNDLVPISIKIFNRWGNLVYEANGVDSNWDGKTNTGVEVAEGTYFYLIYVEIKENGKTINKVYQGSLTLLR